MIAKILISTSLETRVEEINKTLQISQISSNHPDLLYFGAGEKLGMEQARVIKEHLNFKPLQLEGKITVIEDASNLTPEAQNALLKTLEELQEKAIFIMGISSEEDLLPTILSRCELIHIDTPGVSLQSLDNSQDIQKLLNSSMEERFEYIEKLKDKKAFLRSFMVYFQQELHTQKGTPGSSDAKFLKELLQAEEWINKNVNPRAILEYLMLIMPKF